MHQDDKTNEPIPTRATTGASVAIDTAGRGTRGATKPKNTTGIVMTAAATTGDNSGVVDSMEAEPEVEERDYRKRKDAPSGDGDGGGDGGDGNGGEDANER